MEWGALTLRPIVGRLLCTWQLSRSSRLPGLLAGLLHETGSNGLEEKAGTLCQVADSPTKMAVPSRHLARKPAALTSALWNGWPSWLFLSPGSLPCSYFYFLLVQLLEQPCGFNWPIFCSYKEGFFLWLRHTPSSACVTAHRRLRQTPSGRRPEQKKTWRMEDDGEESKGSERSRQTAHSSWVT